MEITNNTITPYEGIEAFKLMDNYSDVISVLKTNHINYELSVQSNKGCSPEVPWNIIKVNNCITLLFAFDKLWEIYLEEGYLGKLTNGIYIGMNLNEAKNIDKTLEFDDWNEDYQSKLGYWLEDSLDTGNVSTITIFIKEAENDEEFFSYHWVK